MSILFKLTSCFLLYALSAGSFASSYEADLPSALSSDADMCRYLDCKSVAPLADSFSPRVQLASGRFSYAKAFRTENGVQQLVGYVWLSTDIADIPAYSGKPVVTLIGMDAKGVLSGVRILKHSEPILLVGIPEQKLTDYVSQYLNHPAGTRFELGRAEGEYVPMDAISGATVTLIAQNQLISRTSYEVAKQIGLLKEVPKPQAVFTPAAPARTWAELLKEGSVGHLVVSAKQMGASDTTQPYLDLYFGYLNAPTVGQSLLGQEAYADLMRGLKPNEHAIFVVANGSGSFKGSGFVRGGIYDRIAVRQDRDSFTFRDTDYLNLYALKAQGAPAYNESGIFILRNEAFSAAYPWSFGFLGNRLDRASNQKTFANFESDYWLPAPYMVGGRPHVAQEQPSWLKSWQGKHWQIALFVALLAFTFVFYMFRDRWERKSSRRDKRLIEWPRMTIWLVSIVFVGFMQLAQPSVTQLLTLAHAPFEGWRWELFLSDPLIFIFWIFIALTVVLWGRGLFCGWLCPFGSLTEVLYKVGKKIGLARWQFRVPSTVHNKLKWLKYLVFFGLLAASIHSMVLAEKLAEIEPFKTTFLVGIWNRSWPFVSFVTLIFGLSLLTDRPYCKYLCPLGAALALPSQFRLFGLRRKKECGTCAACAVGCGSQAIGKEGKIDQKECLLCLDCMILYYDTHACPPLSQERRTREKAGLPMTPIDRHGYYIPIKEEK